MVQFVHREKWPSRGDLDRDRDRATRNVVRRVRAGDAATTGITPTERIEVEERLTGRREAAAARGACDRTVAPVTNR